MKNVGEILQFANDFNAGQVPMPLFFFRNSVTWMLKIYWVDGRFNLIWGSGACTIKLDGFPLKEKIKSEGMLHHFHDISDIDFSSAVSETRKVSTA